MKKHKKIDIKQVKKVKEPKKVKEIGGQVRCTDSDFLKGYCSG